jgi:hypothetical protein
LPTLTADSGEYFCLYGNLDGFPEWYSRKVNEEILQMTGRPRCHRYPDSQFFIYLIAPMEREIRNYSYLTEMGATVIEVKAETVTADAGDDSYKAKKRYEQAILSLNEKCDKITVSNVATAAGVSQPALSKFIKNGSIVFSEWVSEVLSAAGRTIESTVLSVQNEKLKNHNPPFRDISKDRVMEIQFYTTNCTDLDPVSEDDSPFTDTWEEIMTAINAKAQKMGDYWVAQNLLTRYNKQYNFNLSLEDNLNVLLDDAQICDYVHWLYH